MASIIASTAYAEEITSDALLIRIQRLEESRSLFSESWTDRIVVSGVLEAEAGYVRTDYSDAAETDTDESDATLATMELGIDADITDYASGHVVFLWEEDDTEPIDLDTGFVTLSGGDDLPIYAHVGKMYVPFGVFESTMISDPLTLEMAETRESAVQAGIEINGFYGSAFIFNGDIDEDGKDNHIDNFGTNAGFAFENDDLSFDVSAGYINNILDADGLGDYITESMETDGTALDEYVSGVGASVFLSTGPVMIIGEYITALDEPNFISTGTGTTITGKKISAFHLEIAGSFMYFGRETVVGVAYQGSNNAGDFLPETRMAGTISTGIFSGATLALEYARDEFENNDKVNMVTTQLVIEF